MTGAVRELCALAILCGAVMSVMPEGGVKRVAAIGCTAALLLTLVGAARSIETDALSLELARYRELASELSAQSREARDRLDRSVIEAEYGAYICSEAASLGLPEVRAEVTARWELPGVWLPYEVRLAGVRGDRERRRLEERIEAALGVPRERILWNDEA